MLCGVLSACHDYDKIIYTNNAPIIIISYVIHSSRQQVTRRVDIIDQFMLSTITIIIIIIIYPSIYLSCYLHIYQSINPSSINPFINQSVNLTSPLFCSEGDNDNDTFILLSSPVSLNLPRGSSRRIFFSFTTPLPIMILQPI